MKSFARKIRKTAKKYRRILIFVFCGGISALVEFSLFLLLLRIFSETYFAAFFSFAGGFVASFLLNKFVVFESKKSKKEAAKEAAKFIVLGAANSQISVFLTLFFELFSPKIFAKILTMILIAIWNYFIMGKLIFAEKKPEKNSKKPEI